MKPADLRAYGASNVIIEALSSMGVEGLYPPQAKAIEAGLLNTRESFVVAAPTASGKTLIAEMAALKTITERRGRVVYLVPLRALAREKYEEFSKRLGGMGLRVMQSTGEYEGTEPWLDRGDVVIVTNEKMDSLIRHRAPLLKGLDLVVVDEIHMLRDPRRGPTLEIVLTHLRLMKELRFIGLSATIPNAGEIAAWLGARLVQSDWRPVPLLEGVYLDGRIGFGDGREREIEEEGATDSVNLAADTVREGGQVIIFLGRRKSTETTAEKAGEVIHRFLTDKEKGMLEELSRKILSASPEPTRICGRLASCVKLGAAFHHAGVLGEQRKLVEDAFRQNWIKCIAATTTLAMGLNLPSRRVIIRDWMRYESGMGMQPIPVIEIKQMSGRAGRPKFDSFGEAVIVARNRLDQQFLMEHYVGGKLEKIESQLGSESALRSHILASIAGMVTKTRDELMSFLEGTFYAHQRGMALLGRLAEDILEFLEAQELVTHEGAMLKATPFGRRVSGLYIDPLTAVILRKGLEDPREKGALVLLHLVAQTPDMMVLSLREKDRGKMLELYWRNAEKLLIFGNDRYPTEEVLSQLKTAAALMEWIEETPEQKLVEKMGIGPGDLRSLIDLASWLLYSASEIALLFKLKEVAGHLAELKVRVQYGVKEELLRLVSLRGVGRVRARNLYDAGLRSIEDLRNASIERLTKVPAMGPTVAREVKEQVMRKEA